jgi:hypothetical protein
MITYELTEYQQQDKTVEVIYTNSEGLVYKRIVNIPHKEDGSIDQEYFQSILEGQLNGVINKTKFGVIEFQEASVGISTAN